MKEVINNLTGELIEIPEEENAIVNKEVAALVTDDVLDDFYQLQAYQEKVETIKYKLMKVFKENGIKSFKNEYLDITYIPEHISKRTDTELMKKAGIYDDFLKESKVKESIKIKVK